jgi:hypothetical protein
MIRNEMKRTATGAATLALAIGILMTAAAPTQAQYRSYDDRNGYSGYDGRAQWSNERMRDYAFKLAYHNAYTDAERDYDGRSRFGFRDMPGYRTDGNGYLAWMGSRDDYRAAYRRGYEAGFIDSLESRPRRYDRADVERVLGGDLEGVYDNDGGYRDDGYNSDDRGWDRGGWNNRGRDNRNEILRIAQQNGYRDGLRVGQEDRNRRGSNFDRSDRFRDALAGYRSEYGNRDFYRQAYRDGFRKGYEEGFRSRGRVPRPF